MTAPERDWGFEAQQAAEKHLDLCDAHMYWEEEGEAEGEDRPEGESPAIGPYCGCQTCTVRETLYAAWPIIEEAVRSGDFDSEQDKQIPYELDPEHRASQLVAGTCCHCPICTRTFGETHLPSCTPAGPWTSHGHDIPGVTVAGEAGRPPRMRCGGPRLCAQCALEAGQFHGRGGATGVQRGIS